MRKNINEIEMAEKILFLSEYKYYTGDLNEAPEDEEDESPEEEGIEDGDDISDEDLDLDSEEELDPSVEAGDDLEGDIESTLDDMGSEEGMDMDVDMAEDDEVEIDVSEIVDGVNKNAESITNVGQKVDSMTNQVNDYINKLMQSNQQLNVQINKLGSNIEKEFKKRAPTPYEDIQMRSLSSYPYNIGLTDYWKPSKGGEYDYSIDNPETPNEDKYDVKISQEDETPKEYILTTDDVEDYNDLDIRNSI